MHRLYPRHSAPYGKFPVEYRPYLEAWATHTCYPEKYHAPAHHWEGCFPLYSFYLEFRNLIAGLQLEGRRLRSIGFALSYFWVLDKYKILIRSGSQGYNLFFLNQSCFTR